MVSVRDGLPVASALGFVHGCVGPGDECCRGVLSLPAGDSDTGLELDASGREIDMTAELRLDSVGDAVQSVLVG